MGVHVTSWLDFDCNMQRFIAYSPGNNKLWRWDKRIIDFFDLRDTYMHLHALYEELAWEFW